MINFQRQIALDRYLETVVLVLMAFGTVFVFSAAANIGAEYKISRFCDFVTIKQMLFLPLAIALMYLFSRLDYRRLNLDRGFHKSIAIYLLAVSFLLLAAALVPGIGIERNYSRRWLGIPLGPATITFQPSELAKWSIVFFIAAFSDRFADTMGMFKKRFLPVCAISGVAILLIVSQDFGTAAFIAMLTFLMLLIGGARLWHFLTPLPVVLPVFIIAILVSPTRRNRIEHFFDPGNMLYQAKQSLIAISTGKIWGTGLGKGVLKYGHLPEDTTDFIFSVIAEEMGFVGAIFIVLLFVGFTILGLMVAIRTRERFGKLLAAGIILTISIQALINIGVVTVMLPTKGIPLPLISAGGTSMLLAACAIGVLLNIARTGNDLPSPQQQPQAQDRFPATIPQFSTGQSTGDITP